MDQRPVLCAREWLSRPALQLRESFSVQLGSQHKTAYNVRLQCTSVAGLLAPSTDTAQEAAVRATTAMTLYSHSLAGLVLLTAPDAVSSAGTKGLHPGSFRIQDNTRERAARAGSEGRGSEG